MYSIDSNVEWSPGAQLTPVVLTSTGDKDWFQSAIGVEIVSFGGICTTTFTDSAGSGVQLGLDKAVTWGSGTGRVASAFGTLTLTHAQAITVTNGVGSATAPNIIKSIPVAPTSGEGAMHLYPGQEAILKCISALATGGAILPFVEWKPLPEIEPQANELVVTS